ncbi:MAG: NAD-dependent epimerase/dehydratase family protein [Chitinophagaceae bacterium]
MKILVTGASGYVGNNLSHALAGMGNEVHALVRSGAANKLLQHPNIIIHKGDILDKESLLTAMKGCQQVYHTAAMVAPWAKDNSVYYAVNVDGTRNVLDVALQTGVEKLVFTSSGGVIGPSLNEPMTEKDPRIIGFKMDYELSKKMGEDLVLQYAKEGMEAVVVSPSKVYGPGNVSHALTSNAVIEKFLKKGIVFIPSPGTYKACFAFVDDIVKGHLLAMEKGKRGEKYILGGANISYYNFFDEIRKLSGGKGKIIKFSKAVVKSWAILQMLVYKITGIHPRFTIKAVDTVFSNYTFSSEKAIRELGYTITPLKEALQKTIHHLKPPPHA